MNDEKQDGQPINTVDRVIYEYLDEMLHDPAAEQPASSVPALARAVRDNIAHFDVSKKKLGVAPAPIKAEPAESLPYSLFERPALLSEALLRTPLNQPPAAKVAVPEPTPKPEPSPKPAAKAAPPPEPEKLPEPTVSPPPQPAEDEALQELALEGVELKGQTHWCENGRPAWAQSRFECLIFTVNGLKLAVPLITLGSVHQIDRKFNALPGQFDWFLGILQTPNAGNIKVLDTGLCVMPERYDPASRDSLAYVITIHGYSWGLACHEVEKSITLEPDQVKWRTQRGKRPWLAGTVVDYMCSLVDTDGFQEVIIQAEQLE